jgi:hypothetical protein
MQQIQLAFFVEIARENEFSGFAKLCHPGGVSRAKLLFELLANFLGQRWALSGS